MHMCNNTSFHPHAHDLRTRVQTYEVMRPWCVRVNMEHNCSTYRLYCVTRADARRNSPAPRCRVASTCFMRSGFTSRIVVAVVVVVRVRLGIFRRTHSASSLVPRVCGVHARSGRKKNSRKQFRRLPVSRRLYTVTALHSVY